MLIRAELVFPVSNSVIDVFFRKFGERSGVVVVLAKMNDFVTGHSPLAYLEKLHLNKPMAHADFCALLSLGLAVPCISEKKP